MRAVHPWSRYARVTCAAAILGATVGAVACGDEEPTSPTLRGLGPGLQWDSVIYQPGTGASLDVGIQTPMGRPTGVIVVFPWGFGSRSLVEGIIESYWNTAAPAAGYLVVGVEINGPDLEGVAPEFMPALLAWLDARYPSAAGDIFLTGASNGGRGVFYAATAVPSRLKGIIGMPGAYVGTDSSAVPSLSQVPVWMIVGENDTGWVQLSQATFDELVALGADVTLDVLPGQPHIVVVPQQDLIAWIDAR